MSATEKPHPLSDGEWREIPHGWIKEYDYNSNAWYYVDCTRSPARSIWVHPHDDPLFLKAHPQYRLSDEFPPEEAPGLLEKLKASTIGRSEKAKKREERRAQEKDFREWKERLSRQNAHAAKYGSPPQWTQKKTEMNSQKSDETSVEHTNDHDHDHGVSHAIEGTGSGTASVAVHVGAVAGGEAVEAGGGDATHCVDAGSGGGSPGGGDANPGGSAQDDGGE